MNDACLFLGEVDFGAWKATQVLLQLQICFFLRSRGLRQGECSMLQKFYKGFASAELPRAASFVDTHGGTELTEELRPPHLWFYILSRVCDAIVALVSTSGNEEENPQT